MSKDPIRWLDDPNAPTDIAADLVQSAGDPGPDVDLAAGLEAIHATLAVSAGAAGVGSGAAATAAVTKSALSVKLISLVIGGVALAIAGGYAGLRMSAEPPAPEGDTTEVAPALVDEEVDPLEEAGRDEVADQGDERANRRRRRRRRGHQSKAPEENDALQREIALLARARAALESRPALALSLSDRGHREFPEGVFYEEREATAILALTALGRTRQAKRRGEAFLRRFPRGTFARRVRGSIEASGEADESPGPE